MPRRNRRLSPDALASWSAALIAGAAFLLAVVSAVSPMPVYHAHGGDSHAHANGAIHHSHGGDDVEMPAHGGNMAVARHRAEHTRLDADAIRARMVPVAGESPAPKRAGNPQETSAPDAPTEEPAHTPETPAPTPDSSYYSFASLDHHVAPVTLLVEAAPAPAPKWPAATVLAAAERYSCSAPRGPPALG